LELLDRLLPVPTARLLDVGGATGAYAVPMCERGYTVDLIDPIPLHVDRAAEIARDRGLDGMTSALGDARALNVADDDYDATLLLGPLYHLTDAEDRSRALREAVRVTRPGGVVVGVGISRFASLLDGLKRGVLAEAAFRSMVEQDLRDGQHRNPEGDARPELFTTAYFHTPDELEREARAAGLVDVRLFAVEGPAWIVESASDVESQLVTARAAESERSLMGATSHLLVSGSVEHRIG
jgi:ubiquinone/menaquinone biosynthesis C-methylase UbiE